MKDTITPMLRKVYKELLEIHNTTDLRTDHLREALESFATGWEKHLEALKILESGYIDSEDKMPKHSFIRDTEERPEKLTWKQVKWLADVKESRENLGHYGRPRDSIRPGNEDWRARYEARIAEDVNSLREYMGDREFETSDVEEAGLRHYGTSRSMLMAKLRQSGVVECRKEGKTYIHWFPKEDR